MPRNHPRVSGRSSPARFIDTTGNATLGVGICSRCNFKFPLGDLADDPNLPGFKVCAVDRDDYDPYRLPTRGPDHVQLPFSRPDQPLDTPPQFVPATLRDG